MAAVPVICNRILLIKFEVHSSTNYKCLSFCVLTVTSSSH